MKMRKESQQNSLDCAVSPINLKTLPPIFVNKDKIEPIQAIRKKINSQRTALTTNTTINKFKMTPIQKTPETLNDTFYKCRICLEEEKDITRLISSCNCLGSIKYLHSKCLKQWLITCKQSPFTSKCEICHSQYNIGVQKETKINKDRCKSFLKRKVPVLIVIFLILIGCAVVIDILAIQPSNTKNGFIVSFTLYSIAGLLYLLFIAKVQTEFKKECFDVIILDWEVLDISSDTTLTTNQLNNKENNKTTSKVLMNNYVKETNISQVTQSQINNTRY